MAKRHDAKGRRRVVKIDPDEVQQIAEASLLYRDLTKRRAELLAQFDWKLRFFGYIDIRSPDECWEWQGSRQRKSGHGRFQPQVFEKSGAHQIAYLLMRGPIPEGKVVCHRCDNPPCCNPSHLWLGSQADNQRDSWAKGRRAPPLCPPEKRAKGKRNGSAKLTPEAVRDIRASSETIAVLAARYGVTTPAISSARLGKSWAHVEGVPPKANSYKLSADAVADIRASLDLGQRQVQIARRHRVSPNHVSQIKSGVRHVQNERSRTKVRDE